MTNDERLERLRKLIDEENPTDGIHNSDVEQLHGEGGECPRYLACTSEGSGESSYRDNPDYFAGELREVGGWLAGSYQEGWAANWVVDLDTGHAVNWQTTVWVGERCELLKQAARALAGEATAQRETAEDDEDGGMAEERAIAERRAHAEQLDSLAEQLV